MFAQLEIFRMAHSMASQSVARHSVIAENIANADTPEYRARDIASFSDTYQAAKHGRDMRSTRHGHLVASNVTPNNANSFETEDPNAPNGNNVSLETEMVRAGEVRHQHELAMSIYSTSLGILRASLGRN